MLALLSNGTVKSWGRNNYGQLGIGNGTSQLSPVTVAGLTDVMQLAAGYEHSIALLGDNTIRVWGNNSQGQLGNNSTNLSNVPISIGLANIQQVAAGYDHTVALANDGSVRTWGHNGYGELGLGNAINARVPALVSSLTSGSTQAIATGSHHTVALATDGTLRTVGWNAFGQLGIGNTTSTSIVQIVPGVSNAARIAAGGADTMVVTLDGAVKGAGDNSSGQLGIGNTTQQTSLVPLAALN